MRVAILTIFCVLQASCSCNRDSSTRVKIQLADPPGGKSASLSVTDAGVPHCPPAGLPVVQQSASTGHHKVTLSWNASAPSPNPENNAVGYCLYRSRNPDATTQKPPCSECAPLNSVPVPGTTCVDDLVEDGVTYHYWVTAVNAKGRSSDWSNSAPAEIPVGKPASSAPGLSPSPPACRQMIEAK